MGLTKIYGGRRVVDDISFEVAPGSVTAFLGPNGAGKSTTLRMLTGLTRPNRGESRLAGRKYQEWANPAHLVGVLLDASAVHPGRTGARHLRNAALSIGVSRLRVDHVLDEVGLTHAADEKVGNYSLGMRQRLGLAQALLGDPPVLVLDEPINGLDPSGIRDIRALLRDRAAQGGTVLVSSHILSEVEQTADRIIVIGDGRLLADGPLRDLLTTRRCIVGGPDMSALSAVLVRSGIRVTSAGPGRLVAEAPPNYVAEVAFRARVRVYELVAQQQDLEELFFQLSGRGRDA